jgi:hypothetical protein
MSGPAREAESSFSECGLAGDQRTSRSPPDSSSVTAGIVSMPADDGLLAVSFSATQGCGTHFLRAPAAAGMTSRLVETSSRRGGGGEALAENGAIHPVAKNSAQNKPARCRARKESAATTASNSMTSAPQRLPIARSQSFLT